MFDYRKIELAAGAFVLLGLAAIGYLSISIGGLTLLRTESYQVRARFANVGDLKDHAPVKIAGVTVGRVESITLTDYRGETVLTIERAVALPRDTIASITTAGLLGEAYVSLSPGGAAEDLGDSGRITYTEPALNLTDIIGRYAFGSPGGKTSDGDGPAPADRSPTSPLSSPPPSPSKELAP